MTAETQRGPTQKQISRLYTLAGKAGLDHAAVHREILARYGAESTKELPARHYEQFCAFLQGMVEAQRRAREGKAPPSFSYPRLHDKHGIERELRREWPKLVSDHPSLARDVAEVLDYFRLWRASKTISPNLVRGQVQMMQKLPPDILSAAVEIYLTRYTSRNENYFHGIARRLKYDARQAKSEAERQEKIEARKAAEAEQSAQAVIAAAGGPPDIPVGRELPSCPFCEGKGQVWYETGPDAPLKFAPCPWCVEGRREMLAQIKGGRRFDRLDWTDIKEQIQARLPSEDDDAPR